jgi:hypothetical protein
MIHYKLEYINNGFCLKIDNNSQSGCSIAFAGGLGLIMFLLPILTMFFLAIEITFGSVLICMVAWLISWYFIRLYLWNKYGTEVFIIKDNIFETYNNYKFFKDAHKIYNFTKIEIVWFEKDVIANSNKLEQEIKLTDNTQLSVIAFQIDDKIITSHNEIAIADIIKIAKDIKSTHLS